MGCFEDPAEMNPIVTIVNEKKIQHTLFQFSLMLLLCSRAKTYLAGRRNIEKAPD